MLPDNAICAYTKQENFLVPFTSNLMDYEWGGIALNDATQGLQVQIWSCYYENGLIKVKPSSGEAINVLAIADVTEVSFAFDQNMRVNIIYVSGGIAYLYWYDSFIAEAVTTTLGASVKNPRMSLDDARANQTGTSDIVLAYVKDNLLCMRVERDRYLVEYVLTTLERRARLRQIGMTAAFRFQFMLK